MFKNPFDPDNTIIKAKIKEWIGNSIKAEKAVNIEITELLHCLDRLCPDMTTKICISFKGETKTYTVAKPLVYVRKWDIEALKISSI